MQRAAKGRRAWAGVLGLVAVLLAAALPAPVSASVPTPSYAETRVWAFELEVAAGVGAERALTPTGIGAYSAPYDELAVGYPLVPRGTTLADDAFTHGYSYHPRIRARGLQDPKAHNFPYSFDDVILRETPVKQADGSLLYRKAGTLNETEGVYEIAVNPETGTIFHRTFRRGN